MGLFNGYINQAFELTPKQIFLEYGSMLLEGETIEKAVKLNADKLVFTNYRLFLILSCKRNAYEFLSVPYSSIRMFSTIRKNSTDPNAELKIYLQNESRPIRKTFKNAEIVNDITNILAKYIFNISKPVNELPMMKLN